MKTEHAADKVMRERCNLEIDYPPQHAAGKPQGEWRWRLDTNNVLRDEHGNEIPYTSVDIRHNASITAEREKQGVLALLASRKSEQQQSLVEWIEEATDQLCGDKPLDKMALLTSYEKLPISQR